MVNQLFIIGDNKLLSLCYIIYITNGSINYNLNCKQMVIQIHKQIGIQIHKQMVIQINKQIVFKL